MKDGNNNDMQHVAERVAPRTVIRRRLCPWILASTHGDRCPDCPSEDDTEVQHIAERLAPHFNEYMAVVTKELEGQQGPAWRVVDALIREGLIEVTFDLQQNDGTVCR